MKVVYRKFVAALFLSLLILPFIASYSFAADYDPSPLNEEQTKEVLGPAEDFSLDGLSAEASDGGAPLLGDECKLGLSVSGNSGSLGYKFVWEQGGWARWGTIRKSGSSASCSWVPEVAGDVNIWVDVVDSTGGVTTRKFPVHVDACRVSVDGGTDLEWAPGMSVGIHAAAAPGAQLKFVWQKDSWSKWGTAQAASAATSCTWKPSSSGEYEIYVDVTVGGLSATETLPVNIAEDFSLDGLSAEASDGGAPLLGDECKLGLSVSGNSGSLAYKFVWEQGGWARWGTIRKSDSSASCSWVPEVAGDVNIWVDVVDSTGGVTTRKFPVHVENNLENFNSISIESPNGVATAGDSVVITPNLNIRKNQGIFYKYVWMKNSWKEWGVIDSGEGKSSLDWSVKYTGDLSIYVDVVDTNTGQTLTCSANCHFAPEQWTYTSLSTSDALVKPGDEVSIQANCDGVTGFLSYKFVWSKNNWSKWGVAQSGANPVLSWTPDSPGEYDLYCDVSGSDGKVTSRSVHIGVWGFSGVAAVSTDGNLSWGVRADLGTLDAEKSGQFQFKFVWAKPDWSSWGVLKNGSTENNAHFNPSELGLNSGYYDLYCDVTFPDGSLHTKSTQIYYNPIGSSTVLGVSRISLVTWLMSHQYDSYYLGTRYSSGFSYDTCLYPNGSPRWDGFTGMNCTGFVAHAYSAVGGNVSAIGWNNSHSPWAGGPGGGGYINAWRWYGYACDSGCKMYEFRTVQDMLNSGYAQKGDIIFFKTDGSTDCHIGFFWGDTPYENKMWHQILPGNLIGPCFNNANKGEVRQSVVLIK